MGAAAGGSAEVTGLAQGVHAQALRTPGTTAVCDGKVSLDYAALDAAGAAVAEELCRRGVRPGQAVAVQLPRSWRLVAVMLGVLRLGARVVPLDALSPRERRRHILADADAVVLVHGPRRPDGLPEGVLPLAADGLLAGREDLPAPQRPPFTGAPVSFLFYTSGTTGLPKGVEVRDAGVLRLARPGYLELTAGARFACLSNPAFDALTFEVWVPLLTGGTCVIVDDADVRDPERLAAVLVRERIDTLFVTAALFNAVVDTAPGCFAGARQVLIGGEQLNARALRGWYRHNPGAPTALLNGYGPTETTTFAVSYRVPRDFAGDVVPIGRPLPGTGAVVVADGRRVAVAGEVGELCLSGSGVAAGYRNLPEETGRRFVRLPWYDGGRERHYRTGDLVRADADGLLTYVGRVDRQVKVRGFRIEPGELERRIVAHPAVRRAHVCTRRAGADGPYELLAFLVADDGLSYAEFERHLADGLPTYMRPHHLFLVDEVPLTANGKVDETALLARAERPWRRPAGGPSAVVTPWQREVLGLAGAVLGLPDVAPGDRWVAAGGDSLKALRFCFEVRRRWGCELDRGLVLGGDLASIAEAVATARGAEGSPYPAVPPPSGAERAPATSEQQRLWLHQQRSPGSRAYHVGQAFRLDGVVDAAALRRALRGLVARHPALRTGFEATPEGLCQVVGAPYDPWTEPYRVPVDEEGQRAFAAEYFAEPFDLASPRMLRACLLPDDGGGVLLLQLHHIAVDGWSLNVLFRELSEGCAAPAPEDGVPVEPPAAGFTPLDHAHWQAAWHARPTYRTRRAELAAHYGRSAESGEPLLPARALPCPEARLLHTRLDTVRRTHVDRLCAELGLTRFQVLLGVFAWGLYAVTGRTRPRIAAPVAGRPVPEFADGVGMFANTVLLPLAVAPGEGLRAQLLRWGAQVREVLDRQDVAFSDVLEDRAERGMDDGAPFDVLFVQENTDFAALRLPGCTARPLWWPPSEAKCPLTLSVVAYADGLECVWEYAADHFGADEIAALDGLFRRGVDLLAAGGADTADELAAPYRAALPDHGRGPASRPAYPTVAEGFARQVARTPHAPAVDDGAGTVDYATLDRYAAVLAARLRAAFPVADGATARVALYLEPSLTHVVALLALARLNLTAVPLDPSYPPAVLRQVLEQAEPLCVVVPPEGARGLDAVDPEGRTVRYPVALSADAPAEPFVPHAGARPLYALFTSGSSGTPKGVEVSDRTLCNLLTWQAADGGLGAPAATQQFSMLSFDVSFQEVFGTLCGGGTLHLIGPGLRQDPPALLAQLESSGAQRIHLPYVALQLLAEHAVLLGRYPAKLREVVTAGEPLVCTDAIRRWFAGLPGTRLFNHYGPTETHVVAALCLDGDPALWPERPAIGRPVAGAVLRVVDQDGRPVPPGCPGELLIGGTMAARCYLGAGDGGAGNPLNTERFTELPGSGLCYRSGDRARFDRDGLLHYLGRDDAQIKLSGHRLELGQVEAALLRHPEITNAVVVPDGDALVACFECRADAPAADGLAAHLATLLPAYVRIARFRRLATLPRTPSGKLDRAAALRAPGDDIAGGATDAPALSPRERQLAALFEAVTGTAIAPDRSFFEAGASSLTLMRYHLRCAKELGTRFTVADLFEHVTVRTLARFLDVTAGEAEAEDTATPRSEPARTPASVPSPAADASDTPPAGEPIAVIGMAVRLPGAVDLAAFWELVRTGARGIEHFDAADGLVGARSQMAGLLDFDPDHFGISRAEARLMDPQQRHLLMCAAQALAHAGIADPSSGPSSGPRTGLIAGAGESTYFQSMLREADPSALPDGFRLALHHEKDFLATKAAYHLGLTGPAFTAQAACASSLVAVHLAAGLLRQGDADVMLAGGVLVDPTLSGGYRYQPQHIFSADGHCRPFSDDANGTVGASGVGVVVLKPLRHARRDGDTVYAVLTGSAVNNDGSEKLGYSAPSLAGQREVIRAALRRSGRTGTDLCYVEAHGTGTRLGDPVEIAALRQAFGVAEPDRCALTSVKSQLGHLGAAAGVVGLIRAVLSVHHGVIPPHADFRALNPHIDPDPTPFHFPTTASPWPDGRPRVAAVSSFGIGGTNAHVVLEGSPDAGPEPVEPHGPLFLSASSAAALRTDAERIADYLAAHPQAYGAVLRHLRSGRPARRWRAAAVCPDAASAVRWLRSVAPTRPVTVAADSPAQTPDEAVAGWLVGAAPAPNTGPAPAPWDFPPPAFDLAEYDFPRARADTPPPAPDEGPRRLDEADWLSQPHWVRWCRAGSGGRVRAARRLVLVTDGPVPAAALREFADAFARVVRVTTGAVFADRGDDVFEVDPADVASWRQLLDALGPDETIRLDSTDWLHALPLGVTGPVGRAALERAERACLDSPAALVQALADVPSGFRPRLWWLSYGAQPVEGGVERPELGLLAGVATVAGQEGAADGRWLDLPGSDPADWAGPLPALLTAGPPRARVPERLALRHGHWWHPVVAPLPAAAGPAPQLPADGDHVVLGGTGGIGTHLAAWLLERTGGRVLLLSRRPHLPPALAPWADRVELIEGDLADADGCDDLLAQLGARTARLATVTHAAGVPTGGLLVRRPAAARDQRAKLHGALLMERLIARYSPALAVYCSSMSARLGGIGQYDYAAAAGLLDGFAHYRPDDGTTARLALDWDVWREVGMALRVPASDARHRAHLAVGLTTEEGQRVFGRAVALQLPQLLVSTTDIEQSRAFYAGPVPPPNARDTATPAPPPSTPPVTQAPQPTTSPTTPAALLTDWLRDWLDADPLDPDAPLYDLGADSLTLLDLISVVKQHYGVEVDLAFFGPRVSLNDLLAHLAADRAEGAPADAVPLDVWQEGTGREVVCLVHPVGGDIQAYRSLVSALDARATVCLIADPALRDPSAAAPTLAERARRYHEALDRRFGDGAWNLHLTGWSFGAWTVVGMAAHAEAAGRPVRGVHLLDPPPPDSGPHFQGYDDQQLERVFAHELSSARGAFTGGAQAYARRLAQCCRANLASMVDHRLPRLTATPARVWLAQHPTPGLPAPLSAADHQALWRAHLALPADWRQLPTDHYGIVRPPQVHAVAAALNAALDAAPARP
ncbi:amino acid adenylation domain-containing protein [Streptomyces sp. NPDC090442]|uniref:amino acid adenylation domain-containing protein n=1 Tax=Streptomyces sp. NPDC090442 TaxID=3365962 RepID=UPI00382FFD44